MQHGAPLHNVSPFFVLVINFFKLIRRFFVIIATENPKIKESLTRLNFDDDFTNPSKTASASKPSS